MRSLAIGIPVHADPERLRTSLASVKAHTEQPVQVLLLPDGPDRDVQQILRSLHHLPQLATSEPRGVAACFNRLVSTASADVFILLESGSLVGPGWLDYLLAALDSDPRHGLAGPSTNHAWNEQGIFPHAGDKPEMIAYMAREAAQRFGPAWRVLEPLHSLSDFCYAVRREVVDAIGAADEGYGLGPCWEMDYNIRAARAGWRGVWACGAYVYRQPFTKRRAQAERLYFEASKHRYQDKFCELRLDGTKRAYESHCRGERCEFFAPASKLRLFLPFERSPLPASESSLLLSESPAGHAASSSPKEKMPLVTCVMPTRDRLDFVLQSIRYFQRQDYPEKELIIVDDSAMDISQALPDEPRIRLLHSSRRMSIGAKRNWACQMARGQIIAQWDDDDYYGLGRLTLQVAPLLGGHADISGLVTNLILDLPHWQFWRLSPGLHNRMFLGDIHGGTLVYWLDLWRKAGPYPDRSLTEDAFFLSRAIRHGARLARLDNQDHFIYVRHGSNSWSFECGRFIDPGGWQHAPEPPLPAEDQAFYSAYRVSPPKSPQENMLPLVSAIMPTANRRPFVGRAIEYFHRQDYPKKELIVVDDGTDAIDDLIPKDETIVYLRLAPRRTVGAKRNLACERARGEMVIHWDDDDWHSSHRMAYQVESLLKTQRDVCGINNLLFYDQTKGQAWHYIYPANQQFWLSGSTLCYRKAFWASHRFPEIDVGEDARFVWSGSRNQMAVLPDSMFHVGIIHGQNVSPKQTRGVYWKPLPVQTIQELLGEDWLFYQNQPAPGVICLELLPNQVINR